MRILTREASRNLRCFIIMSLVCLSGCIAKEPTEAKKYEVGDRVRTVVGGYEGQVVSVVYYSMPTEFQRGKWFYRVRVAKPRSRTDTHVLRQDEDIEHGAFSIVEFYDYELESWEKK